MTPYGSGQPRKHARPHGVRRLPRTSLPGARRPPLVGLALVLVTLGVLAGLVGVVLPPPDTGAADHSRSARSAPEKAGGEDSTSTTLAGRPASTRAVEGREVLAKQAEAVLDADRADYRRTVDPRADEFGELSDRTFDNLRRMDLAEYRFGTPGEDPGGLTPDRRRELGANGWVGDVEVTLRLAGPDREPWTTQLRVLFVERNGRTYVANDREGMSSGSPLPLWLTDDVDVVRGERSIVLGTAAAHDLRAYARDADQAVPRVTEVWGRDWARNVVLVVPRSQRQMEQLVDAEPGSQGSVAAVTTSVGRKSSRRASHIVVNPDTFTEVGQLGRLVVLTHETTHVATDATVSGVPMWLSEGFADYVGFSGTNLSVSVIAQELFDVVQEHGVPDDLPDAASFDSRSDELDQSYEAAWLACRYIAEHWSEEKLLKFYRAMEATDVEDERLALYPSVLGVEYDTFVAGWRAYVEDADVVE